MAGEDQSNTDAASTETTVVSKALPGDPYAPAKPAATTTAEPPKPVQAPPAVAPAPAPAAQKPASLPDATVSIPVSKPGEQMPPAFVVPESLKEKPWTKNVKDYDDLWTQMDNLQSLVGRQGVQMPNAESTKEQVDSFFQQLGVPESWEQYELQPIEWKSDREKACGDFLAKSRPEEFMNQLKHAAHHYKILPWQLQGLMDAHERLFVMFHEKAIEDLIKAEDENNQDFSKRAQNLFGDQAGAVLDNGKRLLNEMLDDRLKPLVAQLPNDASLLLAAALENIASKYIREDGLNQRGTVSATKSQDEVFAEVMRIQALPEYSNPSMGALHKTAVQKVKDLYASIGM